MNLSLATAHRRLPFRLPARGQAAERAPGGGSPLMLAQLVTERRSENNFDLLRLVGAILVLFSHSFDLLYQREPLTRGYTWGDVGVIIFFSISGFLVCRSWDYDARLGGFAAKRALRLLPGLLVALLVTALVLGPIVTANPLSEYFGDPLTKAYILNNATLQSDYTLPGVFVHNVYPIAVNGSLWTLPLEAKAYLLLAVVGVIGLKLRARFLIVPAAAYAVIAMFTSGRTWLPGSAHYATFLTSFQMPPAVVATAAFRASEFILYCAPMAAFGIGSALYVLRRFVPIHWLLALLVFIALCLTVGLGSGYASEYALALTLPYLVLCLAYRTHSFVRLPRWWGDYSYGIYVYAFPIQQTISQLLAPMSGYALFGIALVPTVAASVLSWHFVEKRMLSFKRAFGGSTADVSVPRAGVASGSVGGGG
jgi:peptidoglycan/LPS O-acetylase OafA/YrhL